MIILIQVPPHAIYETLDRSFMLKQTFFTHKMKVTSANSENNNQSKECEGE